MVFNPVALKLYTLQKGSRGDAVEAWQRFLLDNKYPVGAVDGGYGNVSTLATRNYQEKNGIFATGVVDIPTYTKALTQGFVFYVANITAKMLLSYINFGEAQVKDLQQSLNAIASLKPALTVDGDFGSMSTRGLAEAYRLQSTNLRSLLAQRLSAATKQKLGADLNPALDIFCEYARRQRQRLSGPHWVNYFPASNSIDTLVSPFRQKVQAFERALREAGATIQVNNTYRPPERAYMMHYSVKLKNGDISPTDVPGMPGIDISWVHYTNAISLQAARDMVNAFDIGDNPAALRSRHTQGLAIDWVISWTGTIKVKNASGTLVTIGEPRSGGENRTLWTVGASYGVVKLSYDPPHWSSDGN
ncbi:peptidoglycan-binding protein [Oscillatoria sp. FACHB-1406]|uniref:peptidoglycan-binding domain-containing protein n=1 Tax=Oscillatoria sp. FACHB-1406 TaxID=2692846 RepID=UPI0016860242|nr:peptidoglycan-binding protein [Oscillatoria sp. FACHB-1406]MBD2579337.1 peptidoglycan-binding protein [Oscillatoria sp. FACHB-1406]